MNKFKYFVAVFLICLTQASSFKVGAGSKYRMTMQEGTSADVSIYITENKFGSLGVEYFISAGVLLPVQMWQQFILGMEPGSPIFVKAGYIKIPELKKPEKLTSAYLNVNDGVRVDDFLFSEPKELEKFRVGQEKVEVPAGSVMAIHYRKKRAGQTIDFWISDSAKPIALIKLTSKGKKPTHNYTLELTELLKNVKRTINPNESVPLSEKGKAYLPKPL